MKTIQPLNDNVLICRTPMAKSIGGILVPTDNQEKPRDGIVIAVGPGIPSDGGRIPLSVEVGDRVVFGAYAGCQVHVMDSPNDEEYIIMAESQILGVINENDYIRP